MRFKIPAINGYRVKSPFLSSQSNQDYQFDCKFIVMLFMYFPNLTPQRIFKEQTRELR